MSLQRYTIQCLDYAEESDMPYLHERIVDHTTVADAFKMLTDWYMERRIPGGPSKLLKTGDTPKDVTDASILRR